MQSHGQHLRLKNGPRIRRRIALRQFEPSKVDLLMNELHPGSNEDVPDPWYGPEPGYHEVYAMIDQAADRIIAKYRQPTSKNA